ncbi:unnamed protein product [Paramecium octaurelia]|uniref:Uncharacterized protein n=1 Tax=Paramecium octaurelia TaxID=43137 RepID=A0A8S1X9X4_PAROT|nr:unnamed protein product [Paramecium octaurelia]
MKSRKLFFNFSEYSVILKIIMDLHVILFQKGFGILIYLLMAKWTKTAYLIDFLTMQALKFFQYLPFFSKPSLLSSNQVGSKSNFRDLIGSLHNS